MMETHFKLLHLEIMKKKSLNVQEHIVNLMDVNISSNQIINVTIYSGHYYNSCLSLNQFLFTSVTKACMFIDTG